MKRAGWVRKNVDDPESVADHMYRMAMMALALPPDSGLDRDKYELVQNFNILNY